MFPNKVSQKVSTAEILQNARAGTAVHCLPKSETDGRKSMAAQPFILTIDGVRPFCYSDYNFE